MSSIVTRIRLLVTLLVLGAGGASYLAAQGAASGDRTATVEGWQIEDVSEADDEDRVARVIRMKREMGGQELAFEIRLSGYGGSGWASTAYNASLSRENRSCWKSGPAAVETGAPAQRPARLRAMLERRLREVERECGAPEGTMSPLLDGFEAAFARLSSWHAVRLAEVEAAIAAGEAIAMANDMSMDMAMDMNMEGGDMSMEMSTDMNMVDMNASAEMDAYANSGGGDEEAMEAAADALRAAEEALNETAEPR